MITLSGRGASNASTRPAGARGYVKRHDRRSPRIREPMVWKVNKQRIVAVVSDAECLAGELRNIAPNNLDLSQNIELVIECDVNCPKVFVVERQRI